MPVLEPVVATLIANIKPMLASLEEAKGAMSEFAASAESAGGTGVSRLADGVAGGAARDENKIKTAAETIGEDLAGGVQVGSKQAGDEVEKAGKGAADKFLMGLKSGPFSQVSNIFSSFGGQMPGLVSKVEGVGGAMEGAAGEAGIMSATIGGIALPVIAAGAALAALTAISLKSAADFQEATNQIAAQERITVEQANKVGQAFLTTAGTTTFSAEQMAQAFAPVAGSMRSLTGAAISAKDSLTFMVATTNLAEATGSSLKSATTGLSKVMVAYGVSIDQASAASDVLFKTATSTGLGLSGVTAMLQRMKTQLGAAAPSIQDVSALLVDLKENGLSGRGAIAAVSVAFRSLAMPTAAAADALKKANIQTMDAHGNLLPLNVILGELHKQIQGMGNAQATATLKQDGFGASAIKLVGVVQKGGAAFSSYRDALLQHNSAADAAEKATSGLSGSWGKLKAAGSDLFTEIGTTLMPIFKDLLSALTGLATFIVQALVSAFKTFKPALDNTVSAFRMLGGAVHEAAGFIKSASSVIGGLIGGLFGVSSAHESAKKAAIVHGEALDKLTGSAQLAQNASLHYSTLLQQQATQAGITAKSLSSLEDSTHKSAQSIVADLTKQSNASNIGAQALANMAMQTDKTFSQVAQSIQSAGTTAQSAFSSSYDLVSHFGSATTVTGQQISDFYTKSVSDAQKWTQNLTQAIRDGYDPSTISQLITAGPSKAGAILQGLVSDYSPSLAALIKQSADALTKEGQQAVETARLTQEAVMSKSQAIAQDLPNALAISQQQSALGARATVQSVATALSMGTSEVQRIANEYGMILPTALKASQSGAITQAQALSQAVAAALADPNNIQQAMNGGAGLGDAFARGVAQGLEGQAGGVNTALYGVLQGAIIHGRQSTGMRSPSKQTHDQLGVPLADGVVAGIESRGPAIATSLNSAMQQAVLQAKNASRGMSFSGLPQNSIASQFAANTAQGITTAPVATSAAPTTTTLEVTTPLTVDGHVLARIVTQYQLRQARANGNVHGQYAGGSQTGYATAINPNAISR